MHQPGDHRYPVLQRPRRMAGGWRVAAQVGHPEIHRVPGRQLADGQDPGWMREQEMHDVAVAELRGIPGVERITAHVDLGKGVGAGVLRPAGGKAQRAQVGSRVVVPVHDVNEDDIHRLLAMETGGVGARPVPAHIDHGQQREGARDRYCRTRLPGQEPAQPPRATPVRAGQHEGEADRHDQGDVLLLRRNSKDAARPGQQQAGRRRPPAPPQVNDAGGDQEQAGHGGTLAERAGVDIEERGIRHDQPPGGRHCEPRPESQPQPRHQGRNPERGDRARQQAERDQVHPAGQAQCGGEPLSHVQQQMLRRWVAAGATAGRSAVELEVGVAEPARVAAGDWRRVQPAHQPGAVVVVRLANWPRDQETQDKQAHRAGKDRQPQCRRPQSRQPAHRPAALAGRRRAVQSPPASVQLAWCRLAWSRLVTGQLMAWHPVLLLAFRLTSRPPAAAAVSARAPPAEWYVAFGRRSVPWRQAGGRLRARKYLRHNDVVKYMSQPDAISGAPGAGGGMSAAPGHGGLAQVTQAQPGSERGTRARIARLILENGPVTAAGLSARLGLTPAAVRRHLDNLAAEGMIEIRMARSYANRGRGRPARLFAITDAGRSAFEHAYDDLATSALRFLAERAGPGAVTEFARRQIAELEERYRPAVQAAPPAQRVKALADALSADGYAASASGAPAAGGGEQLCQHHCPVAHVAAQFPQLCEAETEAFGRLLDTPVQRLATISRGDGICTTHVTAPSLAHPRTYPTESGGILA